MIETTKYCLWVVEIRPPNESMAVANKNKYSSVQSAMAKATGNHNALKSGMVIAMAVIPVAPPMDGSLDTMLRNRLIGCQRQVQSASTL